MPHQHPLVPPEASLWPLQTSLCHPQGSPQSCSLLPKASGHVYLLSSGGTKEDNSPGWVWDEAWPAEPGWHQIYPCHSQKLLSPSKRVMPNADPLSPFLSLQATVLCQPGLVSVPWSRALWSSLSLLPPAGSLSHCLGLSSNILSSEECP